ncbi:hypothetical protein HYX08_06540 [Candidatus Woesearchaeota archaeon]|nr:hypothetical protein [Candidatus Woesearchaeota archaeon]
MCYSGSHGSGLEYLVGNSYSGIHSNMNYFSKSVDDNYSSLGNMLSAGPVQYHKITAIPKYSGQKYFAAYSEHFTPEIFLSPSRPKAQFVVDNAKAMSIAQEAFELMMNHKLPENISINILPFDEFKQLHSCFGRWSNGILGFSLNGKEKRIFARENSLDVLLLVIGHEIGHVLTEALPNKHDEEAKAFAFSVEWARTIKQHNVANLGSSIKEDFEPARNGLHDVASQFVDLMIRRGRKAMQLHDSLVRKYVSIFDNELFYQRP